MIHWLIQPKNKNPETGEVTLGTKVKYVDGEKTEVPYTKSVPASLGAKLVREGCWQKVEEIEVEDLIEKGPDERGNPQYKESAKDTKVVEQGKGRKRKKNPMAQKAQERDAKVDTLG